MTHAINFSCEKGLQLCLLFCPIIENYFLRKTYFEIFLTMYIQYCNAPNLNYLINVTRSFVAIAAARVPVTRGITVVLNQKRLNKATT